MARSSKSGEKWGGGVFSDANHPHINLFANVSRPLARRSVDDLDWPIVQHGVQQVPHATQRRALYGSSSIRPPIHDACSSNRV